MSAALVAAKARDPTRITPEAPARVSFEQPAQKSKGQGEQIGDPSASNDDSSPSYGPDTTPSSGADSAGSNHSYRVSPFQQKSSLPPEILGLYNRAGGQSSTPSIQENQAARPPRNRELVPNQHARHGRMNGTAAAAEPVNHVIAEPIWNPATIDSCPIIMIPKNFQPKEGTKLTDDLIVGKHISSGLQGGVFDLRNLDGSKANMVFKLVHTHALLAEVEREWEVGMRLNQLAEEDGSLPGFMGVGAGVRGNGKFRGMLLERLHGTTVDKVICTRDFHDVHYIYAMLYSIFTALDRAQGALGFHHSDLRLANVMEIKPVDPKVEKVEETPSERRLSANLDRLQSKDITKDNGKLFREKLRHQFKIIDYGLANFDETFAAGPDVVIDEEATSSMAGASRRSLHYQNLQLQRQNSVSPATGCVAAFPFPMMKQKKLDNLPNTSPVEKLYRFMWRRKGDVYHLVFELGEWLDGRVWPSDDELEVLRLVDFIEHVTGVRMRFWFSDDMTGENSVAGWSDRALGPFERHDSFLHFLRRYSIRLRSWINPSNPGITAAEALTAPFFTKRISLRGIIHGCSTLYARWTKAPKKMGRTGDKRVVKKTRSEMRAFAWGKPATGPTGV